MNKTVELIADDYEWICPNCKKEGIKEEDAVRHEHEIVDFVTCNVCYHGFIVSDIYHTYG